MKKRGFTLIELLAVIVILAIIALIATPIVMNVIEKSRKGAAERGADNYIDAVETLVMSQRVTNGKQMKGIYTLNSEGNLCKGLVNTCEKPLAVEMSGNKPNMGKIEIENGKVLETSALIINEYGVSYDENSQLKAEKITLSSNTFEDEENWDAIKQNIKYGNTANYSVGDTREVTLTGDVAGTYTVRIANMSIPDECDNDSFSQTACGFVIEFDEIIKTSQWGSTNGGYPASEVNKYLNDDEDTNINSIYEALPEEIRESIIDTQVVSGHNNLETENYTANYNLYLLSVKEVWGNDTSTTTTKADSASVETRQLDYYKEIGVTYSNRSEAIKKFNGSANSWWLRSIDSSKANQIFGVSNSGGTLKTPGSVSNIGISPAFRIG